MAQVLDAADREVAGPLRSMMVGVVFGVDAAGLCLALATLCFGGTLVAGLGIAATLFLFGSAFATLILFYFSSFRLALSISQDTSIAILAPAVILAATSVTGPGEAQIATGLAVIGVSAVASGAVFLAVGVLGLGRLVRMFPYPVLAGFLASSGYLLVYSAMAILTGAGGFGPMFAVIGNADVLMRLVPAVLVAASLFLAVRIWQGPSPVLIILIGSLVAFYGTAWGLGVDLARAVELGLLPRAEASVDANFGLDTLGMIDWGAVAIAVPSILAVVLLNLIGVLLNTSGIELATGEDIDENRELRLTGLSNLLIGMFGGLTSFVQAGATIVSTKLRIQRGPMYFGHCASLVVLGLIAPAMAAVVPTFIPAALLMFIGLTMLNDWLVGTWRTLVRLDWLMVAAIVGATTVFGILPAMVIGLLLAVLEFAFASIRLPVIRRATTAALRRSTRDRSAMQSQFLAREGDRIRILHLQGPLFFGSVGQMMSSLRAMAKDHRQLQALILDFSDVYSFDSSACSALEKLVMTLRRQGINLHVTCLSPQALALCKRWGLALTDAVGGTPGTNSTLHWTSLNDAVEHCENALLAELPTSSDDTDVSRIMYELARQNPRTADLIGLMQRRKLDPDDVLITTSDLSEDVFFIVSGLFAVLLPTPSGGKVRVWTVGPGAILGEIAYLTGQPRNADVVCLEPAVVFCLAGDVIKQVEKTDRDLAALMMAVFGRSIAVKLAQNNSYLTATQAS